MLSGISISLSLSDRARLVEIAGDRNSPQKHVWRARIVLLSADGVRTNEIMRATGTSKTCVWRWQQRFMEAGTDGLLVDKTRPSRIAPLDAAVIERAVALTLTEPPGETTHWTAVAVASACAISVSSVHRIWRSHGLRPHQIRQFKLSNDPNFASKVRDIVGLYVNPRPGPQRHRSQPAREIRSVAKGLRPGRDLAGGDSGLWESARGVTVRRRRARDTGSRLALTRRTGSRLGHPMRLSSFATPLQGHR
jgi:transposase